MQLAYGVIGNTAGFGPVVLGSSPSRPTQVLKWIPMSKDVGIFLFLLTEDRRPKTEDRRPESDVGSGSCSMLIYLLPTVIEDC